MSEILLQQGSHEASSSQMQEDGSEVNEQNHSNTFVICYHIELFSFLFPAGIGFLFS